MLKHARSVSILDAPRSQKILLSVLFKVVVAIVSIINAKEYALRQHSHILNKKTKDIL